MTATSVRASVNIVIGGTGIEVASDDAAFLNILQRQYASFIVPEAPPSIRLEIEVADEADTPDSDDIRVQRHGGSWNLARGDFAARYDPIRRCGMVRQSANRHSIDSVIRIIHTLTLANESGFLLHAASAIRNGYAFLFAGRSGAGKTTLSRHAPNDACLLSDEVSYVRKSDTGFRAWGTPFTGELGIPGANRSAPIKSLCFLRQATANRFVPVGEQEALRLLLTNVLFFADDPDMAAGIFDSACQFVGSVKSYYLEFAPDESVWELIL